MIVPTGEFNLQILYHSLESFDDIIPNESSLNNLVFLFIVIPLSFVIKTSSLNILSKRDKVHWGEDTKQLKVEQKEDKSLNITFDIV